MSNQLEAVRELTQHNIEYILSKKEHIDLAEKKFIGQLDPDLSLTTKIVNKSPTALLPKMISIGEYLMITGMREEGENPVTEEKTNHHLQALVNISQVIKTLPESDKKLNQDRLLMLFSFAAGGRSDLIEQQNFPWEEAIDAAQETPLEFMAPYFSFRFTILKHAPKDILQKKVLKFAQHNNNSILNILGSEHNMDLGEDWWTDYDLYNLIDSMPLGNISIAHDTLFLAIKATDIAFRRHQRQDVKSKIPESSLKLIWESAEKQWQGLSSEDKGQILHAELLNWIDGLLVNGNNIADKDTAGLSVPFIKFNNLIKEMVNSTSEKGKELIVQGYINFLKHFSKFEVPAIVGELFPDLTEKIEANRPKKILKKFSTIFLSNPKVRI